jgi:lipid-A-disaccharide synthase
MPTPKQPHIMFIVGEASGDHHAAKLVRELQQKNPQLRFSGVGGTAMQKAGVEVILNLAQYGLSGFTELVGQILLIIDAIRITRRHLRETRPDLLILVDYPSFNLYIAKYAKKLGIKVFYYISPQVWAWKEYRIKNIQRNVDHMAVILPFEVDYYQKHQVPVHYVGHPLLDVVKPSMSAAQARQKFGLSAEGKVVGLLPGSRKIEIKRLLPVILQSAQLLQQQQPQLEFILPIASSLTPDEIKQYTDKVDLPIKLVQGDTYDVMFCSDVLIVASGTATLEAALSQTPLVIIYKTSWLNYLVGKNFLMKVPFLGLCNLLAQQEVAKELLQHDANPAAIAQEVSKLISDTDYYQHRCQQLAALKQSLEGYPAKVALADLVLDCLAEETQA